MSDFKTKVSVINEVVIIETDGYLNNEGGQMVYDICIEKMQLGTRKILLNLTGTKVVNSIGVSILIEVIEKLQEVEGKLGYYNMAPIVEKTFHIMGLSKYSSLYKTEESALAEF
ncbi:MAG: STAS domain-containing protein [Bacteroidetes bacterium]|nr:STAS domain-containing protein [Bacteroidota bacterium]